MFNYQQFLYDNSSECRDRIINEILKKIFPFSYFLTSALFSKTG